MLLVGSVHNDEVVLAQFFQPASQLALGSLESKQPCQAAVTVVGPQNELAPQKVMAEHVGELHHCQYFPPCHAIALVSRL